MEVKLRYLKVLVLGTALTGALAACVDPALTGASKSPAAVALVAPPPPTPEAQAAAYAALADGSIALPAIPVDQVPAHLRRQEVAYETTDAPGTVIIDPTAKTLHLVTAPGRAMRYGIAVGKDGFQWAGEAVIAGRKQWPTWTPPPEMIDRKPELEKWKDGQPGGLTNPLGARALYLETNGVDYGFRIHGTPEWKSIGRNASSGCFRMINQDVIDLYNRVPDGVKVVVLNADGTRPTKLKLPPPAPKKKKAETPVTPAVAPVLPATPAVPGTLGAPAPGFPVMTAPVPGKAPMIGNLPALPAVPPALVAPAVAPVVAPTPALPAGDTPAADSPPAAAPAATPATPAATPAAPCIPGPGKICP